MIKNHPIPISSNNFINGYIMKLSHEELYNAIKERDSKMIKLLTTKKELYEDITTCDNIIKNCESQKHRALQTYESRIVHCDNEITRTSMKKKRKVQKLQQIETELDQMIKSNNKTPIVIEKLEKTTVTRIKVN